MAKQRVDNDLPSKQMASIGILQRGDPVLYQASEPFRLPDETPEAEAVVSQLVTTACKARQFHPFSKGIGLAAPQIGIVRAAAIVWMPDQEPLILLNPRIIYESTECDEQFEGCLSFFDVRGVVARPLAIEIEFSSPEGMIRRILLDQGAARLAAHEIDHLHGRLYIDQMRPDQQLVDVFGYKGSGTPWQY